ncbi:MAG: ATP-binding protein [Gammaproteobacteria bacterium]|nr:ATP-binding protein [Gammaproteobacteria bacterium]
MKDLKLSGMAQTFEQRSQTALEDSMSPLEFLALLLDDELERREQNRLRRRMNESKIDERKTLNRFDFAATPKVSKTLLTDLALCRFVERGENILFCGPTGTGKSHLAQALAFEAIKRGYQVLFRATHALLTSLHAGRADGKYHRMLKRLINVDVLILDDFGLVNLAQSAVEDLYEIIRERYELRSILITSNRAPEEWEEIFCNPLLASAALDRLTHHAHVITITGASYRQKKPKKILTPNRKKKV